MFDFLTVLEIDQGLAIIRIGLGLWWIKSVLHKPYPAFLQGQMADWVVSLGENHPIPWFGKMVGGMVDKNRSWFPYLNVAGELAVGIGLTLGFLTPLALIVGIFLNVNDISLAGFRPNNIEVNRAYQCEQGQNWNMIVPQLMLLLTGAWATWSVDAALKWFV